MEQATHAQIELAVRQAVAESLAIPLDKVDPYQSLMHHLGAESLDFLDIVFKLERLYQIQITRGELEKAARGNMSEEEFAPNGILSETGLTRLRELMPEAAAQIVPGLRPAHILSLFSVQTLVRMVMSKMAQADKSSTPATQPQ